MTETFRKKVNEFVSSVPAGTDVTYGEVAAAVGHPGAARAVGNIMKANRDLSVPCHRVVRADGTVGGYNGFRGNKAVILENEREGIERLEEHKSK